MSNPEGKHITSILACTDGSEDAAASVRYAALLASQLQAEVVLVHALGLLEHLPGRNVEPSADVLTEVETLMLTTWCEPLLKASVPHRWIIEQGPPLLAIPRVAAREGSDVIVVASHGSGESYLLSLGSTSHGLLQLSPIPVLVVPRVADST